jgi:hypothetical protein
MSESENTVKPNFRNSFAARMLTKELNVRMKTTTQETKISPADAAKYANTEAVAEKKESATVS